MSNSSMIQSSCKIGDLILTILLEYVTVFTLFCIFIDVFGYKSNVSLVFDFMDTDLEVIIKDTSIVLTAANIKSYMLMTLLGLEHLHLSWILHRVS